MRKHIQKHARARARASVCVRACAQRNALPVQLMRPERTPPRLDLSDPAAAFVGSGQHSLETVVVISVFPARLSGLLDLDGNPLQLFKYKTLLIHAFLHYSTHFNLETPKMAHLIRVSSVCK